jgi:hypothetical protein
MPLVKERLPAASHDEFEIAERPQRRQLVVLRFHRSSANCCERWQQAVLHRSRSVRSLLFLWRFQVVFLASVREMYSLSTAAWIRRFRPKRNPFVDA